MSALLIFAALLAADAPAAESPVTEAQRTFFESRVRPTLVERCFECHGPQKQWGALRLDSRAAILEGGDSGPAIVPGKPDDSLLIRAVRHEDENLKMPEKGKLTDRQIADLARWVELGAPFPDAAPPTKKRNEPHWAFQPPNSAGAPRAANRMWPQTPIDEFVLTKLEPSGVAPAARADKAALLRRVTFDLTGLPPTPDDVQTFLSDGRPDAYHRVVERLLASASYGERWGRHWLDVARYADSNGLDENVAHGNAWRYRDYVVAAINADTPFDRFLTEQLAGDLLPAPSEAQRHAQLIATGFLAIGPKVLAEVNQPKMQMDIVDEQLDTVGRVFLGLTLGCARCHDHKFDPIATADYYGLAGVFKSTRTMESFARVARWNENLLPSGDATAKKADFDRALAAKKQQIDALKGKPDGAVKLPKLMEELAALEKNPPELPAAMGVSEDKTADVAIHIRGNPQKLGTVVARHTPPAIHSASHPTFPAKESGRRELAGWLVDAKNPLTARVCVNRVWRWHFGRGLVRTVDNFGLLGEPPTHPELFDWLAQRFIADGWSLKSLHRLIVHSSVYQQDSANAAAASRDPENRLYARAPVRRLEAEEVRDALLAVAQALDRTMGGSLLKVKNRAYFFDHTSIDTTEYSSRRRSIYLPVVRNNVYDLFQLLDFPDPAVPSGDRATTTVAPQALLMINSDLVMQSADALAARVLAGSTEDAERLTRLIQIVYGRDASAAELRTHAEFLRRVEQSMRQSVADPAQRGREAWGVLCHALLASNEFIYVR